MKITFLGTSHGVPARGRNCSAAMIETGNAIYFADGGAPLIEEFLKIKNEEDLKKVRAIFTTHSHGDHTYGIMHMAGLMNWYYKLPLEIHLTQQIMIDAMKNFYSATNGGKAELNPELIKFYIEDPSVGYEDENVKITYFPTAHMMAQESPTYAILVEAEGKKVLFSGDFSQHLSKNDVPSIVTQEHLDLFICEMAHFNIEELTPVLENCKADRVCFNHIWRPFKFDDIRAAQKKYLFDIRTIDDYDVVEI